MGTHRVYLRKEQEKQIQAESERLGIEVNDLIKMRLEEGVVAAETVTKLTERINRLELVVIGLCELVGSVGGDAAFVRGAIEVQARRNDEASKRATELELQQKQLSQKIRSEVEKYL